jgi:hypothetical protein
MRGKETRFFPAIFNDADLTIMREVDQLTLGADDIDGNKEMIQCSLCKKFDKKSTFHVVDGTNICSYCWCGEHGENNEINQ